MVLFLFVIMLLSLTEPETPLKLTVSRVFGGAATMALLASWLRSSSSSPFGGRLYKTPLRWLPSGPLKRWSDIFLSYVLPFEALSCSCSSPWWEPWWWQIAHRPFEDSMFAVPTQHYLILAAVLFCLGVLGDAHPPQRPGGLHVHRADAECRQPHLLGFLPPVRGRHRAGLGLLRHRRRGRAEAAVPDRRL